MKALFAWDEGVAVYYISLKILIRGRVVEMHANQSTDFTRKRVKTARDKLKLASINCRRVV